MPVFAAANVSDPVGVLDIPTNGIAKALIKGNGGLPSEFPFDLGAVDGVAAIVAGAVSDVADERTWLAHHVEQGVRQLQVSALAAAADVVDFADASFRPHPVDRGTVITNVN